MVKIGWAVGTTLLLAVAIAAVTLIAGAQVLDIHGHKAEPLSATTLYDLLKIAFAVAAGVGGVFALVTAYRRQRVAEFAHSLAAQAEERAARDSQQERELAATRLFNERFTTAAAQLGDDKPAAVRLAGVYAMACLADDWPDQRQTCVDVLCAYLRMPYQPDPGDDAPAAERQAFQATREIRHTIIRVITAHLQPDDSRAAILQDWRGLNLDFTGAIFDGGVFTGAEFRGGQVIFTGAEFRGGEVSFGKAQFTGGHIIFDGAKFTGSAVSFEGAKFAGSRVRFDNARFSDGQVSFHEAEFSCGRVFFFRTEFSGSQVSFEGAEFSSGQVNFIGTTFSGGQVRFNNAQFTGSSVSFATAHFSSGQVSFFGARFSGGTASFQGAEFIGSDVDFNVAKFVGTRVDFSQVAQWRKPPRFTFWNSPPPPGVYLRSGEGSDEYNPDE